MEIRIDDLTGKEIIALISEHVQSMLEQSPPESVHALKWEELRAPEITLWSAWEQGELLGCGALKALDEYHGEIKSMRTSARHLRKGVASKLLAHIMEEAKRQGYRRLSLETGSMESFKAARTLYEQFGFEYCRPFAKYTDDPNSGFMTKSL
ncbi:putative acetyltransferase [Paenibacillus sp. UNCCL117]|uniref:GNAT family N-acetyltransferase n=1 Tax=unclassified Paenibacillus TaxID=185978 RepID=UPI000881BC3E|nr:MULTISPECIES: GNAT family N-acetyltransferase [unclassified Paenibacillus]SDE55774.1 putative acetyltransferase [Paenibacillus sp. cl123]SFW66352.1 putative acetyltransferase [Paenibacillus sp. UNCCL117]